MSIQASHISVKSELLFILKNKKRLEEDPNSVNMAQLYCYLGNLTDSVRATIIGLLELEIFGVVQFKEINSCVPAIAAIIEDSVNILANGLDVDWDVEPMHRDWSMFGYAFNPIIFRKVVIERLKHETKGGQLDIHSNPSTKRVYQTYCGIINAFGEHVDSSYDTEPLLKPF